MLYVCSNTRCGWRHENLLFANIRLVILLLVLLMCWVCMNIGVSCVGAVGVAVWRWIAVTAMKRAAVDHCGDRLAAICCQCQCGLQWGVSACGPRACRSMWYSPPMAARGWLQGYGGAASTSIFFFFFYGHELFPWTPDTNLTTHFLPHESTNPRTPWNPLI